MRFLETNWVLVTGATGFVGRHVVSSLRSNGYRVAGLLRESAARPGIAVNDCEVWLKPSDLNSASSQKHWLAIVHLATTYGYDGHLSHVLESNLLLPARLLDFCMTSGCRLFVNTDSFFSKLQFNYPYLRAYVQSKRDLLTWAAMACTEQPELRFVNLRLEHVYGEGDGSNKFVPHLLGCLQRNQQEIALTLGEQVRDFIYVGDVAQAFALVLQQYGQLPVGVTEFEVGTGLPTSLREFVETALAITASYSRLNFGALPYRNNEIMHSIADIKGIRMLGWEPTTALQDGLRLTIQQSGNTPIPHA